MSSSAVRAPITMRIPCAPSSVSVVRQRLRDWMGQNAAAPEVIEDARVVVSELVANSVRHAQPLDDGQILVTWALEPRGLQLSVTDGGGSTSPRAVQAAPSALSGRGMAIVDVLSLEWWAERTAARATVHAILPV